MVLLTVSVTVNPAAQPGAPPDRVAATRVTVCVVVTEVLRVVVGSAELNGGL